MAIKIGNLDISSFKVGSTDVDAIYLGDTLVYSGGTPPTFQGKWLATYSGGTTSSADCDASSAITSGEITLTDLTEVEIGDCVTSIGDYAFEYCTSLSSIDIPDSVEIIGDNVFYGCRSLTSCTIGSGVTTIDDSAFENCENLESIDIPDSVTSIGNWAFFNCNGLTSITVESTTPPILGNAAFDETNNCPIYVPAESVIAYQSDWSNYGSRIQAIT